MFGRYESMKLIYCAVLLSCAAAGAKAAQIVFQSSERQPVLLELYTSEGCSSCPPAEEWLSKLKDDPGLWKEFIPVAFHVDYWNRLGWRDKLSDERYSDRQRNYAKLWSATDIYTPEYIMNGREWRDWAGSLRAPSSSIAKAGVLRVKSDEGRIWQVNFAPAENGPANYEVTAALLASGLSSEVRAGENAGRHLNHDFAALSLVTQPLADGTNTYEGKFTIDASLHATTGRLALAVWVTRSGRLDPLQAVGGWLPAPQKKRPVGN